jgi:alpha-beta hydrolase superfamily lysophospholipase
MTVTSSTVFMEAGPAAPGGVETIAADLFWTDELDPVDVAIAVCLPGGGMSRRYFDLDVPATLGDYSMARYLAERGVVVVTLDPPAVGESDRPDDGYSLTSDVVADVNSYAISAVLAGLRSGKLVAGLPPLPSTWTVGLGHSAGAYLTVVQQARHRSYDALALLGFAGGGLDSHLTDDERRYAGDPAGLRLAIADLVKVRFGRPLPGGSTTVSDFLIRGQIPPEARSAIGAASAPLLALVGLTTMVPGSSAEELAAIDVPVLIGVGELDITGDSHLIPTQLPNCPDITLYVVPGAGHNHNVEANRTLLWDRVARWVKCRA